MNFWLNIDLWEYQVRLRWVEVNFVIEFEKFQTLILQG